MAAVTGPIEESVEMTKSYPSVTDRYFTKYYYIPKECKKQEASTDDDQKYPPIKNTYEEMESNCENGQNSHDEKRAEDNNVMVKCENDCRKGDRVRSTLDSSGHTCVMIHTNKLCLVTLSPRHPVLAYKKEVIQVSYDVGKFNRLENQVSGKGKRGAQMLGPQSSVCVISCADGTRYAIMAGVHGKLVEVNERLLSNPRLVMERPDAEGYLAVVLPPLRTIDNATARLLNHEEYQALQ